MTREEAIARIKDHKIVHKMNEPRAIYISEALDMAIKALEQEPCEDAISRQAVLDLVVANHTELNGINVVMYSPYYKDIKQLPSVQPIKSKGEWERVTDKTGHLVWECKCGWQERLSTNFCPYCGTDMRGEE